MLGGCRPDTQYIAVNEHLGVWHGLLGRWQQQKGGGLNIAAATVGAVRRFSCRCVGGARRSVNRPLRNHLRKITHILATGAAADGIVASEIMRVAGLSVQMQAAFSRTKIVLRDKAHGSTRLLRRPFKDDAGLDQILHSLIRGNDSRSF